MFIYLFSEEKIDLKAKLYNLILCLSNVGLIEVYLHVTIYQYNKYIHFFMYFSNKKLSINHTY